MKIMKKIIGLTAASLIALSTVTLAAPSDSVKSNTQPDPQNQTSQFTPEQIQALHTIIHDYIVKNPEVLVEASRTLQEQREVQQEKAALGDIQKNKQALFHDPNTPTAGNPKGTVYLVEFFDYQCGHCKAMNKVVQDIIAKNRNVKIIFKELPIFGGDSQFAAKAALASVKQGKYYPFHYALLDAKNPLNNDKVLAVAKEVGLNIEELKKDMKQPQYQQQLTDNFKLAQALQLVGTPAFVISNSAENKFKFIPGATGEESLQDAVDYVSK